MGSRIYKFQSLLDQTFGFYITSTSVCIKKIISYNYLLRMFHCERSVRSMPRMVGAGLEERFWQLLRPGTGQPPADRVSAVCSRSIFSRGGFFGAWRPAVEQHASPSQADPVAPGADTGTGGDEATAMEAEAREEEGALFLGSGYLQCRADRRSLTQLIQHTFCTTPSTTLAKKHYISSFDTPGNTDTNSTLWSNTPQH
jgi:hypothetical protein